MKIINGTFFAIMIVLALISSIVGTIQNTIFVCSLMIIQGCNFYLGGKE